MNSLGYIRCTASSGRLNSLSNVLVSFGEGAASDGRSDSVSSTRMSPLPSSTPTPLTPCSSQSLLSPCSPFTTALTTSTPLHPPTSTLYAVPVLTPPPTSSDCDPYTTSMASPHGLMRSHSSSSSVLLGETAAPTCQGLARNHHSVSCLSGHKVNSQASGRSGQTQAGGGHDNASAAAPSKQKISKKKKKPLTHKRSLSNPLTNIVMDYHKLDGEYNQDHTNQRMVTSMQDYRESPLPYQSHSPPSRAGSQPSVHYNGIGISPQPVIQPSQRSHTEPMANARQTSFSQSASNDQLVSASGSDSVFSRQNTWQSSGVSSERSEREREGLGITPRCNSMAGVSRPHSNHDQDMRMTDLTSSSMVDLPAGGYDSSIGRFNQNEDCTLPNSSGKSQSVPRLTLMTVASDERSTCLYFYGDVCDVTTD